jgi:putative tricarboxylic transport membrane protein
MSRDLVSSLILLGIAMAYYWASTDIQDSSLADAVGPRGLPNVLAVLLVMVALIIGARAMLAPRANPAPLEVGAKDASARWFRSAGFLAIAACYIPLADLLGYWPALFLLLIAIPLYEGMKPTWPVFAVAAGGATFFYVLFDLVLGVRQPPGMLF